MDRATLFNGRQARIMTRLTVPRNGRASAAAGYSADSQIIGGRCLQKVSHAQ
jgi:hypothetical protein